MIAHNLKVADLLEKLTRIQFAGHKYVDAYVADELTLVFSPAGYKGPDENTGDEESGTDINDTIV